MPRTIEKLLRTAAATPGLLGLAGGLPSDTQFHRRALAASFLAVVAQTGAPALQYGWPEGLQGLRRLIAQRLLAQGAAVEPNDVIITNGAQQAISLVVDVLLRPGARVGVDPETYPSALDLFRARGLRPMLLEEPDLDAVYVMPEVSNPRGQRMTDAARAALLGRRLAIIEDDAYGHLRFAGPLRSPLLTQDRRRVFYIGSFSKTLCPGLRVGWLVPPARFRARALAEGVSFDPASLFRLDPAQGPTAVRLCFSLLPESQMEEGARRLARAFQRVTRKARGQARGRELQ